MFVACGIWCLADVSSVSRSSEQTRFEQFYVVIFNRNQGALMSCQYVSSGDWD